MSHEVETMAYSGEVPWHGLGTRVSNDLTPNQMMKAAGLDWEVKALSARATHQGKNISLPVKALVRDSDSKVLTVISSKWNPVQNKDAFSFFDEFVKIGDMEMHTAGSLRDGKIVWILAKINESFEVIKGDRVDSYLLFTNPHQYGKRMSIRSTQIRVVCNNTLCAAHDAASEMIINFDHRIAFDAERVKKALGISAIQRQEYRDAATYLASKKCSDEKAFEYFRTLFPKSEKAKKGGESVYVKSLTDILNKQPGADMVGGTWWNAFNAVTYMLDHTTGKTGDTRLDSAWYGWGANRKQDALAAAVKLAA